MYWALMLFGMLSVASTWHVIRRAENDGEIAGTALQRPASHTALIRRLLAACTSYQVNAASSIQHSHVISGCHMLQQGIQEVHCLIADAQARSLEADKCALLCLCRSLEHLEAQLRDAQNTAACLRELQSADDQTRSAAVSCESKSLCCLTCMV